MHPNDDYKGKRSAITDGPVICEYCDDIAAYRGSGMRGNYRKYYDLCVYHGPELLKSWVISNLEELKEFKQYKKQRAKQQHPSSPPPTLFDEK